MKLIIDRELLLDIERTRNILQPFDSSNLTPAGIDWMPVLGSPLLNLCDFTRR